MYFTAKLTRKQAIKKGLLMPPFYVRGSLFIASKTINNSPVINGCGYAAELFEAGKGNSRQFSYSTLRRLCKPVTYKSKNGQIIYNHT